MKSIYKYIAGICMILSVSSCNYLDIMPDDTVTVNSMFADRYTLFGDLLSWITALGRDQPESRIGGSYGNGIQYYY